MNNKVVKAVAGVVAGAGLFGLGWLAHTAPKADPIIIEHVRPKVVDTITKVVTVPGPVRTVIVEHEPTPRPTDCLVMRWTQ